MRTIGTSPSISSIRKITLIAFFKIPTLLRHDVPHWVAVVVKGLHLVSAHGVVEVLVQEIVALKSVAVIILAANAVFRKRRYAIFSIFQ